MKINNFQIMIKILTQRDLRINAFVYLFIGLCYFSSNMASAVELESIGGNLQLNVILFAALEIFASIILGIIITKIDAIKISRVCFCICGISFLVFLFAPKNMNASSYFIRYFFSLSLIFGKTIIGK